MKAVIVFISLPSEIIQTESENTWAVSFIGEVSTVIGSITLPGGCIAKCGELTLLKRHSFHSQMEVGGTVCGSFMTGKTQQPVGDVLTPASHLSILTESIRLTAVHFIARIFAVHDLVTLAGVGDAASIPALELICCAQCG